MATEQTNETESKQPDSPSSGNEQDAIINVMHSGPPTKRRSSLCCENYFKFKFLFWLIIIVLGVLAIVFDILHIGAVIGIILIIPILYTIFYVFYYRINEKKHEFNSYSTAEEAANGIDLTGKCAIVTGGNGGIGEETCRVLYKQNCNVIIAARNLDKAEAAKARILESVPENTTSGSLTIIKLDLSSLESVRTCATALAEQCDQSGIDYLICNAGIMALAEWKASADGYEMQFAVNHLGHWYLTQLLLPLIIRSKTRIINVSSGAARDVAYDYFAQNVIVKGMAKKDGPSKEDYHFWRNYAIGKACNVFLSRELARRYGADGVTACSLHPGAVNGTNLGSGSDLGAAFAWEMTRRYGSLSWMCDNAKSVQQGAATTLRCVSLKDDEFKQGHYYWNCQSGDEGGYCLDAIRLPADMGKDSVEQRLWTLSELLVTEKGFELTL